MKLGPIVATIAVLGGIPTIAWYQQRQETRARQAVEQIEASLQQSNNQLGAQNLTRQLEFVQKTQGEAAAKLFETCNRFPPTQPEGIVQCRAIVDRMNRDMAVEPPAKQWAGQ